MKHLGLALRSLSSLKDIKLDLNNCEVTDTGLERLCHGLKNFDSLQNIYLDCSFCKLSSYGIHSTVRVLKRNLSLKKVRLIFNTNGGVWESRRKKICQAFSRLPYLNKLIVD